jgi:hypothetical protein
MKSLYATLSITDTHQNNNTLCVTFYIISLIVIMLSFIMLNVTVLSVIMLVAVMLTVVVLLTSYGEEAAYLNLQCMIPIKLVNILHTQSNGTARSNKCKQLFVY